MHLLKTHRPKNELQNRGVVEFVLIIDILLEPSLGSGIVLS